MARHKLMVLFMSLGLVLAVLCVWRFVPTEPSYQGKPLMLWGEQLEIGQYSDPKLKDEAVQALRAMGSPAVVHLIKLLEKKDSRPKQAINKLSTQSPLKRPLFPEARFAKVWAADALGEIGTSASAAIPALILASQEQDGMLSLHARAALIKIRNESIVPELEGLADRSSTNWHHLALLAGELGIRAKPAIPALVEALQDKNWRIRDVAVMALGNAHIEPGLCIPALIQSTEDTNAFVRAGAIFSLVRFEKLEMNATDAILRRLEDPDKFVRFAALSVVVTHLHFEKAKAIPLLLKALKDTDESVRAFAAQSLKEISPEAATQAGLK